MQALLVSVLVWGCASLAAAEAPSSKSATASLQVSVQVAGHCDLSNDQIPTVSCSGTLNPMIDTAPALVTNAKGEKVAVLVTTMNF
jgi:hypothetical protein